MMDKNSFISKLYINPIDSLNLRKKSKRTFRLKEQSKDDNNVLKSLPNLEHKPTALLGSVIMQNWNTKTEVPEDIGNYINYPILIDRNKFRIQSKDQILCLPEQKLDFSKKTIREKGEFLLKSTPFNLRNQSQLNMRYQLTETENAKIPLYLPPSSPLPPQTEPNILSTITPSDDIYGPENKVANYYNSQSVALTEGSLSLRNVNEEENAMKVITKPKQRKNIINFSTFNRHLYLRDNDFIYAKRVGGPMEFALCSFQDIKNSGPVNNKLKISSTRSISLSKKSKKLLPSLTNTIVPQKDREYITISKNTVLHYQHGTPYVYSISEWIGNYEKYQKLMQISLFKNFKTAKLFDLWRRFYKKSKKSHYTEKLKKKLHLIDPDLKRGIFSIRKILKEMEYINIFQTDQAEALLLNKLTVEHKKQLKRIDREIEAFRNRVKEQLKIACGNSYKAFKESKRITLDDNVNTDKMQDKTDNKKKKKDESDIQNFLKDSIPYAQDATRKTHYKKLLKYIRLVDYLFNEAKFNGIYHSLCLLDTRWKRLYECYLNKWVDPPLVVTQILCMKDEIHCSPSVEAMKEFLFNNYIQEKIYTVIYKKNFIDPTEFPNYMSVFEEVFESSVDQNSNLNNRIKETDKIIDLFKSLRESFDKCHKGLNDYSDEIRPILQHYNEYEKIDFQKLETSSTPDQLKDLLEKFKKEYGIIIKLKNFVNIGIFEYRLTLLRETIKDAPENWLKKIRGVIPKVFVTKIKNSIAKLSTYAKNLSVNPVDVVNFIKLKKAVEVCIKDKQNTEDENNDIMDLTTLISNDKEIKLQESDGKLQTELKDISVKYERKIDTMSYYVENNIQRFRLELKNEIQKFDSEIKSMVTKLNDDLLINYSDETFGAIQFLEDINISISKAMDDKNKYQVLESDLEIEESLRSNFENLDNLEYDYNLKKDLWYSIKDFQDQKRHWNDEDVLKVNINEMQILVDKWLKLCKVSLIDLDCPNVPNGFEEKVLVYKNLITVLNCIQNKNVNEPENLRAQLIAILKLEKDFVNSLVTVEHILDIFDVFNEEKIGMIIKLNERGDEEKRLKNILDNISRSFYQRKTPIKDGNYHKVTVDKEFEFIENNLSIVNKLFLNEYVDIVKNSLEKIDNDLNRYYNFFTLYMQYQKYAHKFAVFLDNGEFVKDGGTECKKLQAVGLKNNLQRYLKDNPTINKLLSENSYDKLMSTLNNLIMNFETNSKSINAYLDKKRKDFPKYYLLSDDDLREIYKSENAKDNRDLNKSIEYYIKKIFSWIKKIKIGNESEDLVVTTLDDETISIKCNKSNKTLKDCCEAVELDFHKKLKDLFKNFKKDLDLLNKNKKHTTDLIPNMLKSDSCLSQVCVNCDYFCSIDKIEKALSNEDQAFDKLFELYHEIRKKNLAQNIQLIKNKDTPFITRRILANLISLDLYIKGIIENLIREDVINNTDYNFFRLLKVSIESEMYYIKYFTYTLEYGYEYVGIDNCLTIMPETDRTYLSIANCINLKRPFLLYGVADGGKKELLRVFAGFCGKRVIYLSSTNEYSENSFDKVYKAYEKCGGWLCIDRMENINKEVLDLLSMSIMEIYTKIRKSKDDGNTEKSELNAKQLSIFLMGNVSNINGTVFDEKSISVMIKNYYRQIAFPLVDIEKYLSSCLYALNFNDSIKYSKKILFVVNYITQRMQVTRKSVIMYKFVYRIIRVLITKVPEITKETKNEICRYALDKVFCSVLDKKEFENFQIFANKIFGVIDYVPEMNKLINPNNDIEIKTIIKNELEKYKNISQILKDKVTNLYFSMNNFNNFVILGPPLSGKSQLLLLLSNITKSLNQLDKEKYAKLQMVKIFPKSKNPKLLFAENKVEATYQFKNIFINNMVNLFNAENEEILKKLNDSYNATFCCNQSAKVKRKDSSLLHMYEKERRSSIITSNHLSSTNINNNEETLEEEKDDLLDIDEEEKSKENTIDSLVFDGEIDQSWIEYINYCYSNCKTLTYFDGSINVFVDNFKIFYECSSIKNATPSFLIRQCLFNTDFTSFNWETILYSWIDSNEKVTADKTLYNYIKGLFENFFPKIYEFIQNNKFKNVNFSENYSLKVLISIFDSIFPMFNFVDEKIGRRNYNAVPKIEIIKKSTMSIFIFSCAWTMMLTSNFVIKTKIEKSINDIFKADDLKGPIFEYYINDNTHYFDEWVNILPKPENQVEKIKDIINKQIYFYNTLYIETEDTLPYNWIATKLVNNKVPVYLNGKEATGKSFLLQNVLEKLQIKVLKFLMSYDTQSIKLEDVLMKKLDLVKKDTLGDKFGIQSVLYIDDLNMNLSKDNYNTSQIFEYIRQILSTSSIYDSKLNEFKYLKDFNIVTSGNIINYNNDPNFDRMMMRFVLITQSQSDEAFVQILKPTLELELRKYIPNTSGITATQYIQTLIKLNSILKVTVFNNINKIHLNFDSNDIVRVVQGIHFYVHKGEAVEYNDYLKKLFFFETSRHYESKMGNENDINIFREKLCEAYSSLFKKDTTKVEDIFDKNWDSFNSFTFSGNYLYKKEDEKNNNATTETPTDANNTAANQNENEMIDDYTLMQKKMKEYVYYPNKESLKEFLAEKLQRYYSSHNVKDKNLLRIHYTNVNNILRILRVYQNKDPNLLLIGKEGLSTNAIFRFCAFILNMNIMEISPNYIHKNEDYFNTNVITKLLVQCTYYNKKTILYLPNEITSCNWILGIINTLLLDKEEIINNYVFINEKEYGKINYFDAVERLKNNLSICIDLIPKSNEYKNLMLNYPFIVKNCYIVYFSKLNENNLKSYFETNIKNIEDVNLDKEKLVNVFYNIYTFSKDLYEKYSTKLNVELTLTQNTYCSSVEFFYQNYRQFKDVLLKNQKKYTEGIDIIKKCEDLIKDLDDEIGELLPIKNDSESLKEQKTKVVQDLTLEKAALDSKKKEEERKRAELIRDSDGQSREFNDELKDLQAAANRRIDAINKLKPADITEIINTWDSYVFGKFVLSKIFEFINLNNSEWDGMKKTLEINVIKNFTGILSSFVNKYDYLSIENDKTLDASQIESLKNITKEINNDPSIGEEKNNQRPFKSCGIFCEFFKEILKYFNHIDSKLENIQKIKDLKEQIKVHDKAVKEFEKNIKAKNNEIEGIKNEINNIEDKTNNVVRLLDKKNFCKNTFLEIIKNSKLKTAVWEEKKKQIDEILLNFDFYLMYLSTYINYCPPLNIKHRQEFTNYIYSLKEDLSINEETNPIKEISIYDLSIKFMDITGADSEFVLSLSPFNDFYKENFIMMYYSKKIPYIIDNDRLSSEMINQSVLFKKNKGITTTQFSVAACSEMFDKIESGMKAGDLVVIEQCEPEIFNYLSNIILQNNVSEEKNKIKYIINHKEIDVAETTKFYFVKNKQSSKISKKIWNECLVINFTATKDFIYNLIFTSMAEEQDNKAYYDYRKLGNDIKKEQSKLLAIENSILNYLGQIDYSVNIEKNESNQTVSNRYKNDIDSHTKLSKTIENNKAKLAQMKLDLDRYRLICNDTMKIFRLFTKFYKYNDLYMIPLDNFVKLIKQYYKEKFGVYSDIIEKELDKINNGDTTLFNKREIENENDDNENDENDNEDNENDNNNNDNNNNPDNTNNNNNENNNNNDEDDENDNLKHMKLIRKIKRCLNSPNYTKEDIYDLVMFIYNQLIMIYDINTQLILFLLLLFYALSQRDEIPSNYKELLFIAKDVYFDGNLDKDNYCEDCPLKTITNFQWNSLKQINDSGSYVLSIILDSMENNTSKWDEYLSEDNEIIQKAEKHYSREFVLFTDELESTLNPFLKFLLFSIIKPQKGTALICRIIFEITKKNFSHLLNQKCFKDEFITNLKDNEKPILYIENDEINFEYEIEKYYKPMLLQESKEINEENEQKQNAGNAKGNNNNGPNGNNANDQQKSAGEAETMPKVFTPSKIVDLTLMEQELIRQRMKNGGIIGIRNCHLLRDTLSKMLNEIKNSKSTINENFRLILITKSNELLRDYLYNSCRIIHRDISLFTQLKDYILDLIFTTPNVLFNKFMNCQNTICSIFMKKLYISFTILHSVMVQYDNFKDNCLYKIPISIKRKDFVVILTFLMNYVSNIPEDKLLLYANIDNEMGISYQNLINVTIELFIDHKFIYPNDAKMLNKIMNKLLDITNFTNENYLFNYNDQFIIDNFDPHDTEKITHKKLLEKFENIPYEKYYTLIYGLSYEIIKYQEQVNTEKFYTSIFQTIKGNLVLPEKEKKCDIDFILKILNTVKTSMPEILSTSEGFALLFKVNKVNDYLNPLDSILKEEIQILNDYTQYIQESITEIISVIQNNKILNYENIEVLKSLSINKAPKIWLEKLNINYDISVDDWLKMINYRFKLFADWIMNGSLKVYDLNSIINKKYFINLLPNYFIRKTNNSRISAEILKLKFEFTKYFNESEINENVINHYNDKFNGKEFIFIKGLVIKNTSMNMKKMRIKKYIYNGQEIEKIIKCPIAVICFTLEKVEEIKEVADNKSDDSYDSEDEENEENDEDQNINLEEEFIRKKPDTDNKDKSFKKEEEKKEENNDKDKDNKDNKDNNSKDNKDNNANNKENAEEEKKEEKKENSTENINENSGENKDNKDIKKEDDESKDEGDDEDEAYIDVPFVDNDSDPNFYTMKEPYGCFEIKLPKDADEDFYSVQNIKITFEC